ncbi:hypothetical protein YTPLAS18_10620 [Nitrospira sp.]|nr:hypothetical protein YTPLAS18_10620 [Nitrospira sp.]
MLLELALAPLLLVQDNNRWNDEQNGKEPIPGGPIGEYENQESKKDGNPNNRPRERSRQRSPHETQDDLGTERMP